MAGQLDYLIVGQGVGGSSMAWHLHEAGKTFHIVSDSLAPASSRVAAGIFNPLTGKKLVKTWLADELFPYANQFYTRIQNKVGGGFYHEIPIFRPFRSIEEQNSYLAQTADPGIAPYILQDVLSPDLTHYVESGLGGLTVGRSGWVDLPVFLDLTKDFFQKKENYIEAAFYLSDLDIQPESVRWRGNAYRKVIFSRGFQENGNGFFNWLPFTPVKGQILDITTESPIEPYIVNQGIFILPVGSHRAKVGATYSWDPLDWEITAPARTELEVKLAELIKMPYLITGQQAGIRPSVRDRRPLVGTHPEMHNVCIFNGLGTKGVTLAPYFAAQFTAHLEQGKELNPLVNIQRYFSLYFR